MFEKIIAVKLMKDTFLCWENHTESWTGNTKQIYIEVTVYSRVEEKHLKRIR